LTHLASLRDTLRRRDVIQKVNLPVATLPMIDPMLEDKSILEFVDVVWNKILLQTIATEGSLRKSYVVSIGSP
jgi:hypothetical protein